MPKPFTSRKLWIAALTLAAIVTVALTGHDSRDVIGAITAVGGTGTTLQTLLDFKGLRR